MTVSSSPLRPAEHWVDSGYAYTVACERFGGSIMLDVSRVLRVGRMSPIVGRRAFQSDEEPILGLIFGTEGPARTELVDRIIRGGPLSLGDFLQTA